jgi:hypothetical protein
MVPDGRPPEGARGGLSAASMKTILLLLLAMVLNVVVPLAVQLADRARLPREQRERAWNFASWAAALYAFGPLSMAGWVWVTRQDFWAWWRQSRPSAVVATVVLVFAGLVIGILMLVAIVLFVSAIPLLVSWLGGPE